MSVAQNRVYRCGDLYTSANKSADTSCTPLAVDRISVVQAQPEEAKPAASPKPRTVQTSKVASTRVSSVAQTQKDSESRQILETEWRKTSQRLQDLQLEYNHGEPERLGSERPCEHEPARLNRKCRHQRNNCHRAKAQRAQP